MKRRTFVQGITMAGAAAVAGVPPLTAGLLPPAARRTVRLDDGWRFELSDPRGAQAVSFDDGGWQPATLPHTARIEDLVPTPQWQGVCWYRRRLRLDPDEAGRVVTLHFDGAMNVAEVYLDGTRIGGHRGGYLPFVLDISERVRSGKEHVLAVRLDNRDDPSTGPKPLAQLDFNLYHGLYRSVHVVSRARLHITDPLLADRPAGGGVFVTYPEISAASATVRVQVHVANRDMQPHDMRVRVLLRDAAGGIVAEATSTGATLDAGADRDIVQDLRVTRPRLWSPATPDLYRLECEVLSAGGVVDGESTRIGLRRIAIGDDGFRINGEMLFLRGTNRHQEHPYIGYALSDAAQFRDAHRIKQAGFDYVRLSHYPHAPAFMDACDELGLVVMNCIPGWQYFNPDPAFVDLQYRNCRDMIRRDRNRPSVILWEVSLNESAMPPEFVAATHRIAHEEYPGDQCFTAGWMPGYDIFLQARQHGGCRDGKHRPCVVSEYGDWEYYAMNAGLDQAAWSDLAPAASNSRQLRWQGERALLQQATNFQEAHNDNLATVAFADGLWVMFDYQRGYAPDIESSGCMDLFRLPKPSYYFFRSQRSAGVEPVVHIASYWAPDSATDVRVFSNCDEVALSLDGRLVERRRPDRDRMSARLAHPPFTFPLREFRSGTLEAVGYIRGRAVTRHRVRTPGSPDRLTLGIDLSGRRPERRRKDHLFCHAALRDEHGTLIPGAWENVAFGVTGGATLIGRNPYSTEAGIASILLETAAGGAPASVYALALVPGEAGSRILAGSVALDGKPSGFEIRYTEDGTEPGAASTRYRGPVPARESLRAGLLVRGKLVAQLSADTPKFRLAASAPPEQREPFHR